LPVRFGGDEFAVLFPMTGAEQAEPAAARLHAALMEPVVLDNGTLRPRISIGIAALVAADEDAFGLLGHADEALTAAKAAGGDRVVFHEVVKASIDD
jgi:diguanylate cyclase (GGDEF)-like protein